ncbi:MAG: SusC/RagA family TonB-linked outer membrane protein [Gemmatimonadales bacterium]
MKQIGYCIGVFLAVLWVAPLQAQGPTGTIRGRVADVATQRPLQGATVTIGNRNALTQKDGRYLITGVPAGTDSIRVRMIGYAPLARAVTLAAGETLDLDLLLSAQAVNLAEIVVVGYGEQQAGNITGAVTSVSSEEFNTGRIVTPTELIQSKVAGVQVEDNNEPGAGKSIRIRGTTSINASSEPLIIVDGMPLGTGAGAGVSNGRDPLNFLNSDDIQDITVLRDASAASIYGANAANGVIIIQTKNGAGRTGSHFEYSGSASVSTVTRIPSVLNAAQFRAAVQQYAPQNAGQLLNANTNWFDLVDRTAFGHEQNFAFSGSGESMNYRLSANYLNQNGILYGTNTERIALGLNYNQRLLSDRLSFTTNLRGYRENDQYTPGGVLSNAAQMGPTQPVYDGSTPTGYYDWPGNMLTSADNPVAIMELARDEGTTWRGIGNVQAQYSLPWIAGLKANLNVGFDVTRATRQTFTPSVLHSQTKTGTDGVLYRSEPNQTNTVVEGYLNYAIPRNLGPGTLDLTGGYSYSQSHAETPAYQAQGLDTDLLGLNGFPSARTFTPFPSNVQESKLISFFGRANYNINDRYLAAVSIRRDGSSRFGTDNAWGVFPSVALAWRLSEEPFMRNFTSLSDLKLRGSWAKTGNQAFANYQQYAAYLPGDAQSQYQFGNQYISTIRPGAVDPEIKWEATRSFNLGVDWGFSNQRFRGAIDWYDKKTTDLIFTVPVAAGTNLSNYLTTNIGSMRNRGIEFSLSAQLLRGGRYGLSWTTDFTAARNSNELLSINPFAGGAQQIPVGLVAGGVGTFIQTLTPGEPVYSFYVYQHKLDSNGKPIYADENNDGTINEQDLYVDRNNDGVINVADRRPFHDPAPKWILGHSSYLSYGAFDFSFTVRAYLGNYVYNNVASNLGNYQELARGSPYNLHTSVLETGFATPQYLSDYYVEDASFLRMDNLTAGYSFTWRGQQARFFLTAQNAFTITGYSGVDPTSGLNGIDNNRYPRSRTFLSGLTLRF